MRGDNVLMSSYVLSSISLAPYLLPCPQLPFPHHPRKDSFIRACRYGRLLDDVLCWKVAEPPQAAAAATAAAHQAIINSQIVTQRVVDLKNCQLGFVWDIRICVCVPVNCLIDQDGV